MAKIKKVGLDYFPVDTDYMQNRLMRRIMKREGDRAAVVILAAIAEAYANGYYVQVDELFYDDLSACFYQTTAEDVARILGLAVEYGFFDAQLFREKLVLTSADIQRQYLFSTRRRKSAAIDPAYNLLTEEETSEQTGAQEDETEEKKKAAADDVDSKGASTDINVTFRGKNATSRPHSIAQHSIAQHSKGNPLLQSSPGGGTEDADRESAEEEADNVGREGRTTAAATNCQPAISGETTTPTACQPASTACQTATTTRQSATHSRTTDTTGSTSRRPVAARTSTRREWTDADVAALTPPTDGLQRNYDGLLLNLRQFRIPPQEQYAIILKSNFGVIGHPLWRGFFALRDSHGKIKQPGHYLLSLCR